MTTTAQSQPQPQPSQLDGWHSLNIEPPGFKSNKNIEDAFYELIANAIDTDTEVDIDTTSDIVISDSGTGIVLGDFLIGSRRSHRLNSIGQHGLGLKEAITIFMREGVVVSIETVGRRFNFKIAHSPFFNKYLLWVQETLHHRTKGTAVRVHKSNNTLCGINQARELFLTLQTRPLLRLAHNSAVEMYDNPSTTPVFYYYMLGARKGCNRPLHFIYNLLEVTDVQRGNVSSDHTTLCSKKFNKTVFAKIIQPIAKDFARSHSRNPRVLGQTFEFFQPHPFPVPTPTPSVDSLTCLVEQALSTDRSMLYTLSDEEKQHFKATTNNLKELISASSDLNVNRIENSGSLFKGTAVPGFADVDVVVFLNDFHDSPESIEQYRGIFTSILCMAEPRPSAPDILQFCMDGVDFDVVLTSDESTIPRFQEFAKGPQSVQDLKDSVGTEGSWVYDVVCAAKYWVKRKEAACENKVLKSLAIELIVTNCFMDPSMKSIPYESKRYTLFRRFLAFLGDCSRSNTALETGPPLKHLAQEKQKMFKPEFYKAAWLYGKIAQKV